MSPIFAGQYSSLSSFLIHLIIAYMLELCVVVGGGMFLARNFCCLQFWTNLLKLVIDIL